MAEVATAQPPPEAPMANGGGSAPSSSVPPTKGGASPRAEGNNPLPKRNRNRNRRRGPKNENQENSNPEGMATAAAQAQGSGENVKAAPVSPAKNGGNATENNLTKSLVNVVNEMKGTNQTTATTTASGDASKPTVTTQSKTAVQQQKQTNGAATAKGETSGKPKPSSSPKPKPTTSATPAASSENRQQQQRGANRGRGGAAPAGSEPQQQRMASNPQDNKQQGGRRPRGGGRNVGGGEGGNTSAHSREAGGNTRVAMAAAAPVFDADAMAQQMASLNMGSKTVVELMEIPEDLVDWAAAKTDELLSILAQVKAQSGVLSILVKRVDDIPRSLLVTAASLDEAKKAKMLLGIHLKNVEFLDRTEKRMQRVQSDITAVQGAVAAGLRIEFNILPVLTGLVIGKKGAYVNKVYEATGVSKIDIDDGVIRVVGPSMTAVNKAREMLEFQQVDIPVKPELMEWFTPFMLRDIRDLSECATVRLEGEDCVRMIGTKKQLDNGKLLLETQMTYITKRQQLRAHEDEMRQKLYDMESSYGRKEGGGGGRNRDGDNRESGEEEDREEADQGGEDDRHNRIAPPSNRRRGPGGFDRRNRSQGGEERGGGDRRAYNGPQGGGGGGGGYGRPRNVGRDDEKPAGRGPTLRDYMAK